MHLSFILSIALIIFCAGGAFGCKPVGRPQREFQLIPCPGFAGSSIINKLTISSTSTCNPSVGISNPVHQDWILSYAESFVPQSPTFSLTSCKGSTSFFLLYTNSTFFFKFVFFPNSSIICGARKLTHFGFLYFDIEGTMRFELGKCVAALDGFYVLIETPLKSPPKIRCPDPHGRKPKY
jgi:hypothetical protein